MNEQAPSNETKRLKEDRRFAKLDAENIKELNAATELAASLFNCPMALIGILEGGHQRILAKYGLSMKMVDREHAFCCHTVERNELLVIEDTLKDDRFKSNPYVTGDPGVRFYVGVPITIDEKHARNTLCLWDTKPRDFSEKERSHFLKLADMVAGLLRSQGAIQSMESASNVAADYDIHPQHHSALLEKVTEVSGIGGWEYKIGDVSPVWTKQTRLIHEVTEDYIPRLSEAVDFYEPEVQSTINHAMGKAIKEGVGWDVEIPLITGKGRRIWARVIGEPTHTDQKVTGFIGTFQDITQKKDAEKRLQNSEELARVRSQELDVTLASMKQGVSMFDAKGQLMIWNQKYIDIFEKSPEDIVKGIPFREILLAEKSDGNFSGDIDKSISELYSQLAAGKTVERQFERTNGKIISSVHAPMPGGGWVGTHDDVTVQVKTSRELAYAARHDPLTGLANRLSFSSAISHALEERKARIQRPAVLLIDLDGFKIVNDTHGHQVGDELLKAVATKLAAGIRPTDLAARLGGDEFALIVNCENPDTPNLHTIAKRILDIFERPFVVRGKVINIGVSIGISLIEDVNEPIESAINNADRALYKVKEGGKQNYCIFDIDVNLEITKKRLREFALRDVVNKKDFELYYQPVYSFQEDAISGYEALIRWNSAEHDKQQPLEFIPMAEELGLIEEIGDWVIDTAIREASSWQHSTKLAINVSPQQLGDMNVFRHVASALRAYNFPAERLELEITEYAILQDDGQTTNELEQLKNIGVRIVLDDFGTGYSSLSYLHRFPFDKLKIDRSFIDGFQDDGRRTNIIKAITSLAISLGMEVTAEGVETEQQLQMIKEVGCTNAQGYFLGKPKPAYDWMGRSCLELEPTMKMLTA